jgi:hypothetical protein
MGDRFPGMAHAPDAHPYPEPTAAEVLAAVRPWVPVTARMLMEQAAEDFAAWQAPTLPYWPDIQAGTPPLEALDSGDIDQERFWEIVNRCAPCGCWSCDGQCGNSALDDGLVERDENGRWLCESCRDLADVIDNDRQGVNACLTSDATAITLDPDVWGNGASRLNFTPASARALAARLAWLADLAEDEQDSYRMRALLRGDE